VPSHLTLTDAWSLSLTDFLRGPSGVLDSFGNGLPDGAGIWHATFDDLANAMLSGVYTDTQLASLLTGAPIVQSPATTLFHAERMFAATTQLSVSHSPSPRLSVTFRSGNTLVPDKSWSEWSAPLKKAKKGAKIDAPSARYLQVKFSWKRCVSDFPEEDCFDISTSIDVYPIDVSVVSYWDSFYFSPG